jgi:hypothetical protein
MGHIARLCLQTNNNNNNKKDNKIIGPVDSETFQNRKNGQILVAHSYNPSYSGGRNQDHHGSKPA